MKDRAEKAKELFKNGYNCSQSVFTAFADLYGIDKETAFKLSTPLGGGFAGNREICGAISGMAMVVGLEGGSAKVYDKDSRTENYNQVNGLIELFRQKFGSVYCKYLLNMEEHDPPVNKVDCSECVYFCAKLLDENIFNK